MICAGSLNAQCSSCKFDSTSILETAQPVVQSQVDCIYAPACGDDLCECDTSARHCAVSSKRVSLASKMHVCCRAPSGSAAGLCCAALCCAVFTAAYTVCRCTMHVELPTTGARQQSSTLLYLYLNQAVLLALTLSPVVDCVAPASVVCLHVAQSSVVCAKACVKGAACMQVC